MKKTMESFPSKVRNKLNSPFRALRDMEHEMEKWFSRYGSDDITGVDFAPCCDFRENKNDYSIRFDIPGVKKEDVKIELDDNCLTVSGERKESKEEKDAKHYLSETYYGSFMRSFNLPTKVDEDKVDARYENGVLTITIPKSESKDTKKIEIQ